MRVTWRPLALLAVLMWASPALAGEHMFRWVDEDGGFHVSDSVYDVPQPYRAVYEAQLKALKEAEEKARKEGRTLAKKKRREAMDRPLRPPPRRTGVSLADREARRRQRWRTTMATWRQRLVVATERVETVDQQIAQERLNPILRETPQVKARVQKLEAEREGLVKQLESARTMLMETLPAKAKKERVPPKWLD